MASGPTSADPVTNTPTSEPPPAATASGPPDATVALTARETPSPASDPDGAGPLTIAPDWNNPPQAGCDEDEAKYGVVRWDDTFFGVVLGGVTQITECSPPGWATDATFEASQCPPGYTSVTNSCWWAESAGVCCPT